MTFIRVFKPSFGKEELKALKEVLLSGWVGLGPKTIQFEEKFAKYIGVEYCVGVNSGTSALDLAVKLLNINHGDEIIVPTITFVSTAHIAAYNLATPIFVDVDYDTMGLSLKDVKRKITKRTKAIIPVHYGGRPIDIDSLLEINENIPIIEDCAHACGAEYKNKKCGSLGKIGCFSFHAVKNLSMGDGGAITLNDKKLYERAKRLRWLGIDTGTWERTNNNKTYWWKYDVGEIGLKCHMNDIQAAIGLEQLKKLDKMNNRRKEIVQFYRKELKNIKNIELPLMDDDIFKSSWHIFHIKCNRRDELSTFLKDKQISTGVHYYPIHLYPCYGNITSLPIAEKLIKKILTLPLYPDLKNEDLKRITKSIKEFYNE